MSESSTVTERVTIHLKPGVQVGEAFEKREALLKRQEGYLGGYWGRHVEDPNTVEMLLLWSSGDLHHKFVSDAEKMAALVHIMQPLFASAPSLYLVDFVPSPPAVVLDAPVAEMLTFHSLPDGFTLDSVNGFMDMVASTEGNLGVAKGLSRGNVAGEPGGEAIGKVFIAAIGWTSLEANVKGRQSEVFANASKANVKIELHHTTFRAF